VAQLQGIQSYEKRLRADLQELSANLWFGMPLDGQKAGNFRCLFMVFSLPAGANTTFGLVHELGEAPLGYLVVGTPSTDVVQLSPGTDAGGTRLPWTAKYIYLKSPQTSVTICIMLWGTDSSGG